MTHVPQLPLEKLEALKAHVEQGVGGFVIEAEIKNGELVVTVIRDQLPLVLEWLRDDAEYRFTQLMDICAIDFPERPERFEVAYNLLSLKANLRIRVKVTTDEELGVPTASNVFPAAGWFEREVWDMNGIFFDGHSDLRRILTDYGFDGHPLRKDFPLTGFVEVRYDNAQKRVVYEPVNLTQAFRSFDFESPWEGTQYVLPAPVEKKGAA
ncbi:MAG: NADH-quinone oxidoreductase subunit C [Alphaproteobacteria bacterium]|nr:NADH-quinone oxidoreductase subunit C [Alphaproteobacteria bacterium]